MLTVAAVVFVAWLGIGLYIALAFGAPRDLSIFSVVGDRREPTAEDIAAMIAAAEAILRGAR
jgi:hypothetical protein